MTDSRHEAAMAKIQNYLATLRLGLRGLPADEVDDIVREIGSHLRDLAGDPPDPEDAAEAISAFGRATDLAARYRTEIRLEEAQSSFSPVTLMAALVQWASMSLAGFLTALTGVIGYSVGVGLLLAAFLDPIFPDRVGLWVGPEVFVFGTVSEMPESAELLGRWITPVGLLSGLLAIVVTTRLLRRMIARFGSRRPPSPGASSPGHYHRPFLTEND